MGKLTREEAVAAKALLPGWELGEDTITRTFTLRSFTAALAFAAAVGHLAERADHHPDILIRYKRVTLTLTTHSAGGLTEKDFALARELDVLA